MRIIFAYYQNNFSGILLARLETHSDCPFPKNYTFFHAVSPRHFLSLFHSTPLYSSTVKLRFTGSKKSHFRGIRMLFYFPSLFLYESVNEFCDSARGIIRCCNKGRRNVNEPRAQKEKILPSFILQTNSYPIHERYHYDREGIGHYLSLFLREYSTSIRRNGQSKWL